MSSLPPPLLTNDEERLMPSRGTVIFFLSMLIATTALIIVVLIWDRSPLAALFLGVAYWTWILAAVVVAFGPISLAWRLRRARSRRQALVRSEWIVEDEGRSDEDDSI